MQKAITPSAGFAFQQLEPGSNGAIAIWIAAAGIHITTIRASSGEKLFVMHRRDNDRIARGLSDLAAEEGRFPGSRGRAPRSRARDTRLAQAGDDAAEDWMTALMAEEHLARAPEGEPVPFWFARLVAEHGSSVTAARKHVGATQAELAAVLGISQGQLSDVERGRPHRFLTADQRARLAAHAGVAEA